MLRTLPLIAFLAVVACAPKAPPTGSTAPPAVSTTARVVAALELTLTASEKAASAYVRLPLCTVRTRPICSEAAVSARIKAADNAAFDAVMAARAAGDDAKLAAANAALAAFVAAIPN